MKVHAIEQVFELKFMVLKRKRDVLIPSTTYYDLSVSRYHFTMAKLRLAVGTEGLIGIYSLI